MEEFSLISDANKTGFAFLLVGSVVLAVAVFMKNKQREGFMSNVSWTAIFSAGALLIAGNLILFTYD
jgi:predicted phage tail protein